MSVQIYTPNFKPRPWALDPGKIDSRYRFVWDEALFLAPMFEGGGSRIHTYGRTRTPGVLDTGNGDGWRDDILGRGVDKVAETSRLDFGKPEDFDLAFNKRWSYWGVFQLDDSARDESSILSKWNDAGGRFHFNLRTVKQAAPTNFLLKMKDNVTKITGNVGIELNTPYFTIVTNDSSSSNNLRLFTFDILHGIWVDFAVVGDVQVNATGFGDPPYGMGGKAAGPGADDLNGVLYCGGLSTRTWSQGEVQIMAEDVFGWMRPVRGGGVGLAPASTNTDLLGGAVAGAYAVTGQADTQLKGTVLLSGAVAGAYAVTGQADTQLKGTVLLSGAVAGAYAATGQADTQLKGTVLLSGAVAGAYAATGQADTQLKGTVLLSGAVAGAYAVTGQADTQLKGTVLLSGAVAGAYAATGFLADTAKSGETNTDLLGGALPGSYAVTGAAATLLKGTVLLSGALPGSYAVMGALADLQKAVEIDATAGAYAVTGNADTQLKGTVLLSGALPGAYAVTGAALTTIAGELLDATPGVYAVTGAVASTLHGHLLVATAGAYAVTGQADTQLKGTVLLSGAVAGVYAVTGAAAITDFAVSGAKELDGQAVAGSYAVTGEDAFVGTIILLEWGAIQRTVVMELVDKRSVKMQLVTKRTVIYPQVRRAK